MPIVRLSQAIRKLEPGAQLVIEATDAAFHPDLLAWAKQLGHTVVSYEPGDPQRATVAKAAPPKAPQGDLRG